MLVKKSFKRVFIIVVLSVLMYFSITMGYSLGKRESGTSQTEAEDETQLVGALSSKDIIGADTIVEIRYEYKKCGHEITKTSRAVESMLGLGVVDFLERFPSLRIVEFSNENVLLERDIDQYCEKHYIIKLVGDNVMVLRSDAESEEFVVVRKTDLFREDLDSHSLMILQRGKLFNSISDVENYINSIKK